MLKHSTHFYRHYSGGETVHAQLPLLHTASQGGASLIVVMMILVIVSLLGIGSAQIALMGERGARNDRDQQIAFQSAETALFDATNDIEGVGPASRSNIFSAFNSMSFVASCGNSGNNKGLCQAAAADEKPVWLTVDFNSTTSPTTEFGEFTGATFDAGGAGIKPSAKPRYVIEAVPLQSTLIGQDQSLSASASQVMAYRVTAMGYGPRQDIQGVVQMIYRKE